MNRYENKTILIEPFTRLRHVHEGVFALAQLTALKDYLANEEGEIRFRLEGSQSAKGFDGKAGRKMRVKCIIAGCIFIFDTNGEAQAHVLQISNHWVLVNAEENLPALEDESDDEDYIVAGTTLDVPTLIAEEVILNLPMMATVAALRKADTAVIAQASEVKIKPNPFAKLAALKNAGSI